MAVAESASAESIAQLIQAVVNMGFSLITSIISLALFLIGAWGLYTIAKRRNLRHAWLAWLPVGNSWILGAIADQYQQCVAGKKTARRKWLLGMDIGVRAIGGIAVFLESLIGCIAVFSAVMLGLSQQMVLLGLVACLILTVLPVLAISVVYTVFWCIAHYDLFKSCKPKLAVLFLLLSIFFSNWVNIAVFVFRNSDEGMPVELLEE